MAKRKHVVQEATWYSPEISYDEDIVDQVIDVAANYMTAGTVGYENGRLKKGAYSRAADEGFGEITGRNMQRDALNKQRDAVTAEAAARAKQLKDEQTRTAQLDLQASQMAGALRDTASAQRRNALGGSGYTNPITDILGV